MEDRPSIGAMVLGIGATVAVVGAAVALWPKASAGDKPKVIDSKKQSGDKQEGIEDKIEEPTRDKKKGLPPEILRMDKRSQQLYIEALDAGKVKVYNIRLMVVGYHGVGKTTLTKRILGEKVVEAPHVSTEGIEVHPRCCKIDLDTKEWIVEKEEHRVPDNGQLLVNMFSKHVENRNKNSKDDVSQEEKNSTQHLVSNAEQDPKGGIQQEGTDTFSILRAIPVSLEPNKEMSKFDSNETRNRSELHGFVTKYGTTKHSKEIFCYVTMLDFAGQFVFYTTHQTFMSWRTIYLLVTDMSKSLDDMVRGDICSLNLYRNMESSIKDYAVYWLNSIYSHGIPTDSSPQCDGSTQRETENNEHYFEGAAKYPPVILVATHSDKIPEGENTKIKDEYFHGVRRILKERPLRFLLKGYVAISNFGPDADFDALKLKIVQLAQKQDYWGEEIPGRWLTLEEKLMALRQRGEKIIEYSRVEEINTCSDVKIENPEELKVFLRFEHDLGNIVFFNTEKLRDKVVLDPDWLIDGVRILISPRHIIEDPDIYPEWYDFKDTGQLTKSLIGRLWSESGNIEFRKNRDHLLDLMEELSIIAKPVETDGGVEDKKLQYYWVPCVICKSAPDHVKNPEPREGMTKTSTLCIVSKTKFIHVGVFHRLVASFLSKWKPAKEDGMYLLYSGCCGFEVDKRHSLLLVLNDYVILATMLRYSSRGEYPDNRLCSDVRKLISSTLADIIACISPNSKFDICVKCDKSSTDTINGLFAISDREETRCNCSTPVHSVTVENLWKFWEVDKGQSRVETEMPPSVQVPEDSEGDRQGELHRNVLNRCLPALVKSLDFKAVSFFIQAMELFDDVTMRDILEQKTTSDKIEELITRVKQRDQDTYEKFKHCLIQANQPFLKALLEEEEAAVAMKKDKREAVGTAAASAAADVMKE